jgi:DNA-binding NtrC family response regulator
MASAKMEHKTENSKPRLLLVDSNELIRDIFKMLFERLGYYAVTVRTAREGFNALNDENFDIVICDSYLHECNGIEFFQASKNYCKNTTNILMTTYGDVIDTSNINKLNVRHIIEKPFPFEELLRIIKNSHLKN